MSAIEAFPDAEFEKHAQAIVTPLCQLFTQSKSVMLKRHCLILAARASFLLVDNAEAASLYASLAKAFFLSNVSLLTSIYSRLQRTFSSSSSGASATDGVSREIQSLCQIVPACSQMLNATLSLFLFSQRVPMLGMDVCREVTSSVLLMMSSVCSATTLSSSLSTANGDHDPLTGMYHSTILGLVRDAWQCYDVFVDGLLEAADCIDVAVLCRTALDFAGMLEKANPSRWTIHAKMVDALGRQLTLSGNLSLLTTLTQHVLDILPSAPQEVQLYLAGKLYTHFLSTMSIEPFLKSIAQLSSLISSSEVRNLILQMGNRCASDGSLQDLLECSVPYPHVMSVLLGMAGAFSPDICRWLIESNALWTCTHLPSPASKYLHEMAHLVWIVKRGASAASVMTLLSKLLTSFEQTNGNWPLVDIALYSAVLQVVEPGIRGQLMSAVRPTMHFSSASPDRKSRTSSPEMDLLEAVSGDRWVCLCREKPWDASRLLARLSHFSGDTKRRDIVRLESKRIMESVSVPGIDLVPDAINHVTKIVRSIAEAWHDVGLDSVFAVLFAAFHQSSPCNVVDEMVPAEMEDAVIGYCERMSTSTSDRASMLA
jgi:hypothetical protein